MFFTSRRLERLSIIFGNTAAGLFLAGLATPLIRREIDLIVSLKAIILGILFSYIAVYFSDF